jgi:two-component system phosphate regulon response regulator PhoB
VCLEDAGYEVCTFSANRVIQEGEKRPPSLILLELTVPRGNGIEVCRRVRENHALARTPLVFLIPEGADENRALALESGGDDCVVKPFSPRELVARVRAVLRRFAPAARRSQTDVADLIIDSLAMKLFVRGSEVSTTALEFRLIEYLARHRGQVFTRDLLLDAVWGDMQFIAPRSVDACIRRIREKIEPEGAKPTYLKTIRGVGYRLDAMASWQLAPADGCNCVVCATPSGPTKAGLRAERRK